MANDDSLSGDNVTIWFGPVDTVGSDLAANASEFQSYITGFNDGGAEKQNESQAVFSDTGTHGFVTRKKPRTQGTLEFDVIIRHSGKKLDFKKIMRDNVISADGIGSDFVVGMIAIQQTDGGSNYYWQAYNNVESVNFETEFQSDEEWKGTLSFTYNYADAAGVLNSQEGDANITSDLTAWS